MNKLTYWRGKRKMTIRELAQKSGLNPSSIVRIEQGRRAYVATLGKLVEALELDLSELAELAETPTPTRPESALQG